MRLREGIAHCVECKQDLEARRARVAANFSARIDKEEDRLAQDRIRDDWRVRNEEFRIEIAKCESAHSEYRRLLQWLTGELWS